MPEKEKKTFTHTELAKMLVTQAGIHDGHWGLFLEFGLGAANIPLAGPDGKMSLKPAAVIPVNTIGIQKFDEPNPLTVDAAKVNPKATSAGRAPRRKITRPAKGTH